MAGALREVAATFGISWDDADLQRGQRSIQGAIGLVRQFGAVLAGSELVRGIREFAAGFEEQASRIQDTADSLGLTTTQLQELDYAAQQGGVRAEMVGQALGTLQNNAVGAAAGAGPAAAAFHALGIRVRDAGGQVRSASDLLDEMAVAFGRVQDPARRTALAQDLLGRAGRRMLTILHEGEGGLAQWRAEVAQLGGGLTADAVETAGHFGDALNRWRLASDSVRAQLANALLPTLTQLVTWVTRGVAAFVQLTRGTEVVRLTLMALGAAGAVAGARVLAAWLPALRPFLTTAGAIALLVLLVDDLLALFRGGDSVLGRFLNDLFGVGAATRFVHYLQDAWEGMQLAARDAGRGIAGLWDSIVSGATTVWGWITRVASAYGTAFEFAFRAIDNMFFGTLSRIGRAFLAFLQPIQRFVARLGDLAPFRAIAGAVRGIGEDWNETFTGRPGGVGATVVATQRGVPQVRTTTNTTTIHVNGAGDPQAVARATADELARRQRAGADAAHPQPARED